MSNLGRDSTQLRDLEDDQTDIRLAENVVVDIADHLSLDSSPVQFGKWFKLEKKNGCSVIEHCTMGMKFT
ncbi:hypothetical protein SK128_028360 [Halocaridina rubra]|uniref:Uncharacterized protein n=1 Tax=Halocaridina rubra TaxID=373956 RepID=A0AAN8WEW7_HALRR